MAEPTTPTPPPSPFYRAAWRINLSCGPIDVHAPNPSLLTADDCGDVIAWMELILGQFRRWEKRASQPPPAPDPLHGEQARSEGGAS